MTFFFFLVRELRLFLIVRQWSFFLCFLFVMKVEFEKEREQVAFPFFLGIFFFPS